MAITRRTFLVSSLVASGGLLLGCTTTSSKILSKPQVTQQDLGMWLRIGTDNRITFVVPAVEMGQGVSTALPTIVAEELNVSLDQIDTVMAPVNEVYRGPDGGFTQGTGGSTSVNKWWDALSKTGAAAREMLTQAAANRWQVNTSELSTESGFVLHAASGRRLSFGELTEDAARLEIPAEPARKPAAEYRLVGQPLPRKDGLAKVTGAAQFGIDVQLPNLLYATVKQSPVFGGTVRAFNEASAKSVKGVVAVVEVPHGVAVVAEKFWQAKKGLDALEVEFEGGKSLGLSNATLEQQLDEALEELGKAELAGERTLDVEYFVPYLAHATMEPMNCTVDLRADRCDVWVPTQFPEVVRDKVAEVFGLDDEQVTVHTTYLGGGFGRRGWDFAIQAATVARAVKRPVKLIWTREEDTRQDFYRPAYKSRLQVTLNADGTPAAWAHQIAGPSIVSEFAKQLVNLSAVGTVLRWVDVDPLSTQGAELPYAIPDHAVDYQVVEPGVRVGFWRSVGSSHNAFIVESVLDEAAHLAQQDPLAYRLALLRDKPRHRAVLERVATESGWGEPLPAGRARGVALHESFKSIVAQIAEVSVANGQVQVHKVHCVIDCGRYVNPNLIRQQLEGSVVMGLSATLFEAVQIQDGAVQSSNFHDYRLARLAESPEVSVSILQNNEAPGGIGEPGVPPVAPAICNAIFKATGTRIRRLPVGDQLA
jgi:CO/xanthine dehydrogenase Mo-binding subunit